ncbi:SERTA domain-containing protein 3 [Paramarasmius palmivorus]|uniref:SERTA domain-containing protein 3 n=1 Tax=Paramarasmius palmivorus TaxID=297713 RepID=A0AAW0AVS4_9AGAR
MVAHSSFEGSRAKFLDSHKDGYAQAVQEDWVKDFIADLGRRYMKRYPASLPHEEEPSQEHLDAVDDDAPDPEAMFPVRKPEQSKEEFEKLVCEHEVSQGITRYRQIARYMKYRYDKSRGIKGKDNPFGKLMEKLTGEAVEEPKRRRRAFDLWAQANQEEVDRMVERRIQELTDAGEVVVPPNDLVLDKSTGSTTDRQSAGAGLAQEEAGAESEEKQQGKGKKKKKFVKKGQNAFVRVRQEVVKGVYDAMKDKEKKPWEEAVEKDWTARLEKYKASVNAGFSTEPAARQDCIMRLPAFVQPILDGITEATGMHCTMLVGGPEPADMGRLNLVSFHSGATLSSPALNFGAACQEGYRNLIIPLYGSYLRKCFTVEECKSRALPHQGLSLASSLSGELGINLDFIETPGIPREDQEEVGAESTACTSKPPSQAPPPSEDAQKNKNSSPSQSSHTPNQQPSTSTAGTSPASPVPQPEDRQSVPPTPPRISLHPPAASPVQHHPLSSPPLSPAPGSAPPTIAPSTPRGSSPYLFGSPAGSIKTDDLGLSESNDPGEEMEVKPGCGLHGTGSAQAVSRNTRSSAQSSAQVKSSAKQHKSGADVHNRSTIPQVNSVAPKSASAKDRPKPRPVASSSAGTSTSAATRTSTKRKTQDRQPPSQPEKPEKRRKTANVAASITCPEGAPAYVQNLFTMSSAVGMNGTFYCILPLYLALEAKHMYKGGNLKTVNRPDEVQQWYKRRRAVWLPNIKDIARFSQELKAWFRFCSPSWRSPKGSALPMVRKAGDWSCMEVFGPNGMVAFLVALIWWQNALNTAEIEGKEIQEYQSRLDEVLSEVEYTFQNL